MSNNSGSNDFDNLNVEKLPQVVLHTLANNLPNHWKKLARHLGISNQEIKKFSNEFTTVYDQTYEILSSWIRENLQKTWGDIKNGLIFCERNDLLKKCEQNLSVHSIFGVQPSSAHFFSRKKELHEIHRCLFEKKNTLVLCGMSGVGKTQIAKRYCENYQAFYENIIWIDAAFGKLESSMHALYQKLGFKVKEPNNNSFNIDVIIEQIHNYFKNEKTLYIFDNVDNESVRDFEIYISKKPNSFTLITTQWRIWSNKVNQLPIDVFSHEEALNYLKININIKTDDKLRELVKELSCHPFAIDQAVNYINANAVSIETYIHLYQLYPIEILNNDKFPNEEKTMSAIKSINLDLMKLEKDEIISLKVLNCLSHCDGQKINKQFIVQVSKHIEIKEEYFIDEAIRLLVSYSLLDCTGNDKYSMHDLTQLSCQYYQRKNSSTKTFHDLIEKYFHIELTNVINHVDYGNHFYFHFLYMFKKNKKQMTESFHRASIILYDFLSSKGLFQEIIEILKAIQTFNLETYGENNELTLDTKHIIGRCLYMMGKYNEALEIHYSVDKIRTEILGIDHPSTMDTKNNIGLCFLMMGKYNEALEIFYSVDKLKTEILVINHSSTEDTKNNIANCLFMMGKYNEALEIYYSVDKIKTKILGINHPSTIETKHNIANCFLMMGKYNEALEIYFYVDKMKTEIIGINHPSTMETKSNIAGCLYTMGKYKEALEINYLVEKIQTEILGINHPSKIETKKNIARCLNKMGKYKEALEINYYVEIKRTEILGINHPSIMETKNSIASCLYMMGNYKEALEIQYSFEKKKTEILGIDHPSVMETKNNIALCLNKIGKFNKALEINYSVEKKRTEILGINHPSTMETKNNIASCLYMMGNYNEALEIHYSVEKIQTETLGINHPSTMETKSNIANCLNYMGKFNEA